MSISAKPAVIRHVAGPRVRRRESHPGVFDHFWPIIMFCLLSVALTFALEAPWWPGQVSVTLGSVASSNIVSSRSVDYVSAVLTQSERDQLGQSVGTLYRYDAGIGQATRKNAADLLTSMQATRSDDSLDEAAKASAVMRAGSGIVTATTTADVLLLSDTEFATVRDTVLRTLDQASTLQIRPESLVSTQQSLVSALPSDWTQDQTAVAAQLIVSYTRPNSFPDPDLTAQAVAQAVQQAVPVRMHINRGDTIVSKGSPITAQTIEELKAAGMLREPLNSALFGGTGLLVVGLLLPLFVYLWRAQPAIWRHSKALSLIGMLILVTALSARLLGNVVPGAIALFPMAVISMLVAVLLDTNLAILLTGILAAFVAYVSGGGFETGTLMLLDGLVGILAMWHIERLSGFVIAGLAVVAANLAVGSAFLLLDEQQSTNAILVLALQSVANGALSAMLTVGAFGLLGFMFGITTSLQLMELSRPNQPLLRQLLLGAPGTYHHSIIVSNLAERAADAIDADALLARVGSYYHDIGKVLHPEYFIENQLDQPNIHETLLPEESARRIADHVTNGIRLGKQNHLPKRILDIIAQHHGLLRIGVFYERAVQLGGTPPDEHRFRYPGPRPSSREAAIIMLADATEAATRAAKSHTSVDIAKIIARIVDERIDQGELEECDLTLRDLAHIKEAFLVVLSGVYHTRIDYQRTPAVSDAG